MPAKDDFEKKIKSLIKAQRKVGSVTLAQLNSVLPDDMTSPEKITEAIALIEDAGLDVVEDEAQQKGKKGGSGQAALDDNDDVDLTPDADIAEPTAERSLIFFSGSGPPSFTATEISLPNLENILARFLSCAPFRCIIFLNLE